MSEVETRACGDEPENPDKTWPDEPDSFPSDEPPNNDA